MDIILRNDNIQKLSNIKCFSFYNQTLPFNSSFEVYLFIKHSKVETGHFVWCVSLFFFY